MNIFYKILATFIGGVLILIPERASTAAGAIILVYTWAPNLVGKLTK